MKSMNEQLEELANLQKRGLEPMQKMNSVAAEAFERIARQNYEMMGDIVDYAVAQVQIPASKTNAREIIEEQMNQTRAFAEKINSRASEYLDMVGQLGELAGDTASESFEPMREVATDTIEQVRSQAADTIEQVRSLAAESIEQLQNRINNVVEEASKTRQAVKAEEATAGGAPAARPASKTAAARKKTAAASKKPTARKTASKKSAAKT